MMKRMERPAAELAARAGDRKPLQVIEFWFKLASQGHTLDSHGSKI
jgi:hypothetical protein